MKRWPRPWRRRPRCATSPARCTRRCSASAGWPRRCSPWPRAPACRSTCASSRGGAIRRRWRPPSTGWWPRRSPRRGASWRCGSRTAAITCWSKSTTASPSRASPPRSAGSPTARRPSAARWSRRAAGCACCCRCSACQRDVSAAPRDTSAVRDGGRSPRLPRVGGDGGFRERVRMPGDPVADPAAQVRAQRARCTVLTDRLLRLEWARDGVFEDRGTYAFPNRRATVPPFSVRSEDGATVIDTGALVLRHAPDGRPLHGGNTSIELTGSVRARWAPGMRDLHNLGGARRTVDGCRGDAALESGLASRSGWALVDDSAGFLFTADGGWVEARRAHEDLQDLYFFGYGHDYAAAVADYTRFGGRAPLIPRWVLGAWWSRYWPYSADDVRALVGEFRARELPLDVFVLDMDWHTTHSWTGYSWNRRLFPDPRGFLEWLHGEGLHTTLNLHPALGVQAFEEAYPEFARAMGVDPAGGGPVPVRIAGPEVARHYFELLHHPLAG